jgi:hypothetical protein
LFQIIQAGDGYRFALGTAQGRQQHSRQYCNDGNDYQQFNERESFAIPGPGDLQQNLQKFWRSNL